MITREELKRIYLKMESDDVGVKAKSRDTYGRKNNLVPIEKIEKEFGVPYPFSIVSVLKE